MNELNQEQCRNQTRAHLYTIAAKELAPKPIQADFSIELEHGWFKPSLWKFDSMIWGRWAYNICAIMNGQLPEEPLPQIDFKKNLSVEKMVMRCLDAIPGANSSWRSWADAEYFRYFLDWLLFAFGSPEVKTLEEPRHCSGASSRLYQVCNICAMQLFPFDYFADILCESHYGRSNGFFPTPMDLCMLITDISFDKSIDNRYKSILDPCMGTGRFPLAVSNYTMDISCQDIDGTMVRATMVNGYLYAPWLVSRPVAALAKAQCDLPILEPFIAPTGKLTQMSLFEESV